jgi:hypothetical protein
MRTVMARLAARMTISITWGSPWRHYHSIKLLG